MEWFCKDSIAFFHRVSRVSKRYMDSALSMQPRCHFGILHRVAIAIEADGQDGCISVSELAKKLYDAPQAVSRGLRILEEDNLIERLADPADRRKTLVRLTPEGQQAHDICASALEQHGTAVAMRLGAERLQRMQEDFNALLDAMEAEAALCEQYTEEE